MLPASTPWKLTDRPTVGSTYIYQSAMAQPPHYWIGPDVSVQERIRFCVRVTVADIPPQSVSALILTFTTARVVLVDLDYLHGARPWSGTDEELLARRDDDRDDREAFDLNNCNLRARVRTRAPLFHGRLHILRTIPYRAIHRTY